MSSALLTGLPVDSRVTLITAGQGTVEATTGANVAPPYTPLVFDVSDDDGIVAANSVVSHVLAAVGVLATDKVIGVAVPQLPDGSQLLVTAAVAGADFLQLSYKNVSTSGATNGTTTYTVFIARFP